MVVGFEASNDALIFWLDVRSKVRLEIFNLDIFEVSRNDVARKVVLEKYLSLLFSELIVPFPDPGLIDLSRHPSCCIISVVKPQLST
jgi:hypothetical protein